MVERTPVQKREAFHNTRAGPQPQTRRPARRNKSPPAPVQKGAEKGFPSS